MKIYQSPVIFPIVLESLQSKLQGVTGITGVPICDSQVCGEFLGIDQSTQCDFGPGPSTITVQFFAPGATEDPPPCELSVTFVTPEPGSEAGTGCSYSTQDPIAVCNGGGIWQITCIFSDGACDLFTAVIINCPTGNDECTFIER